ncbi:hypothetical protein HPT27_11515 [Permianibacter sp. IMCC34836]|uniref:hypothetical protein n=1 Tax=Permianibacter fluminis TaxID=2738515 RepID=UPI001556F58D|nr:hypothetical protein [Permianibacter fluminis]NQD37654.1 hypothetical protein [Permianibacter fluminis]
MTKKNRGRPARLPLEALRAKIWYRAVSLATGLDDRGLQARFDGEQIYRHDSKTDWSRKWKNYKEGLNNPRLEKVLRIEAEVPGTAQWHEHFLWHVIRTKPNSQAEINDLLLAQPQLRDLLFVPCSLNAGKWQRADVTNVLIHQLAALGNFDGLATLLLFVWESELISSLELRSMALRGYRMIQEGLRQLPVLQSDLPELLMLIDSTFPEWVHLSPDKVLRVVIFSQELPAGYPGVSTEADTDG